MNINVRNGVLKGSYSSKMNRDIIMIESEIKSVPGCSGSLLMDYRARLVGIVTQGDTRSCNVAYSVSVDDIITFLESYKMLLNKSDCSSKCTDSSTNSSLMNLVI